MATAKKLPSGKYRVRSYSHTDSNGKKIYKSFTAATKKEAEMMALMDSKHVQTDITLIQALNLYCSDKSAILSPATIRGYMSYKHILNPIADIKLKALTQRNLQSYINTISATHSPKTVRNVNGLISTLLKYNNCNILNISMPQSESIVYSVLTKQQLSDLLQYAHENDIEMYKAISLGACMLRRSEICGLTAKDISNGVAHVHNVMVQDENGEWIIKVPKTTTSDRYVQLPDSLIRVLPKRGTIVDVTPTIITHRYKQMLKTVGIPPSRFHDLRHFGASMLHALGVPDAYIMKQGGWSSDKVLKQVYRNTLPDYEMQFAEIAQNAYNNII